MKCRGVAERLSEFVDGELADPERAAIVAHLEFCAGCRGEADDLRRAGEALRALAVVEVAPELTGDLHRRLAVPTGRRFRLAWVGVGVAAAAGAAVCLLWLSRPAPAPRSAPARAEVAAPQVVVEPPEQVLPVREDQPEAEAPREPYRAPARVVARDGETKEPAPVKVVARDGETEEPAPVKVVARDGESEKPAPVKVVARDGETEEPAPVKVVAVDEMLVSSVDNPAWSVNATMPGLPTDVEPSRHAVVQALAAEYGVVLLLGPPEPVVPSSRCYLEVSFPDGGKSIVDQTVERDAAGDPLVVQLSYRQIRPEIESVSKGG